MVKRAVAFNRPLGLSNFQKDKNKSVSLRQACIAAMIVAIGAGCSTGTVPQGASFGANQGGERADHFGEIQIAAADLQRTNWPSRKRSSLIGRLIGRGPAAAGDTAALAGDAYYRTLQQEDAPLQRLLADADETLEKAERLTQVASLALERAQPNFSDVGVLESAIQQLQRSKSVYLTTTKRLAGDAVERELTALSLRGRFDAAVSRMSHLADDYADAATGRSLFSASARPQNGQTSVQDISKIAAR